MVNTIGSNSADLFNRGAEGIATVLSKDYTSHSSVHTKQCCRYVAGRGQAEVQESGMTCRLTLTEEAEGKCQQQRSLQRIACNGSLQNTDILEDCRYLCARGGAEQGGDGNPNQGQPCCELLHQVVEELIGHDSHQGRYQHHLEGRYCQTLHSTISRVNNSIESV